MKIEKSKDAIYTRLCDLDKSCLVLDKYSCEIYTDISHQNYIDNNTVSNENGRQDRK